MSRFAGRTVGIVGCGRIGSSVARKLSGFEVRLLGFDPYVAAFPPGVQPVSFERLLAESDYLTIHCPLTPETHHLIDAARLKEMKSTAVLVNTSRGPVIDEAALADALETGEIFAAGLDVFENEPDVHPKMLELENAVVIPHLGSATVDTRIAMGLLAADNLIAALEGGRPPTLLNPDAWERRTGGSGA